jgi:hypothetical protein
VCRTHWAWMCWCMASLRYECVWVVMVQVSVVREGVGDALVLVCGCMASLR